VLALEAILLALFMIFIGPRILSKLRPSVARLSAHNAPLIVALMVCLGLSFAAAKIGMAAIIGAFFAGMIFSECSPEWDLRPRVHAITEFLGPFFFFSIGSQLDVKLFNGEVLGGGWDRIALGDHFEGRRLWFAADGRGLEHCAERGRRHDASRRSRPDCGPGRPEFGDRFASNIRDRGLHDSGDDGARAAIVALLVPQ
jgi:hypothetical protein